MFSDAPAFLVYRFHRGAPVYIVFYMKTLPFGLGIAAVASILCVVGCGKRINSIGDDHFDRDGYCLDSLQETFLAVPPTKIDFYVESSGSMNGFFRRNQPTDFKKDVWSIVSNFGNPGVAVLSNDGTHVTNYSGYQFQTNMNTGSFVSNASTKVPEMLKTILNTTDFEHGAVAVLISDMKYSPVGARAVNALTAQYKTDIRNVVGQHKGLAYSVICAYSNYLAANGSVAYDKSPYYYVVIGIDQCVAYVRNAIITLIDDNGRYLEDFEMGFDYKAPAYVFGQVENAIQLDDEPTFYAFNPSVSDTCSFTLGIDLSGYLWKLADEDVLRQLLKVNAVYGSTVELGKMKITVDNHYNKELLRTAMAAVRVKVTDMLMDNEVIEWSLDHPEYMCSQTFETIMNCPDENDLSGSFSMNQFIEGVFAANQNHWTKEPRRILISKNQ